MISPGSLIAGCKTLISLILSLFLPLMLSKELLRPKFPQDKPPIQPLPMRLLELSLEVEGIMPPVELSLNLSPKLFLVRDSNFVPPKPITEF